MPEGERENFHPGSLEVATAHIPELLRTVIFCLFLVFFFLIWIDRWHEIEMGNKSIRQQNQDPKSLKRAHMKNSNLTRWNVGETGVSSVSRLKKERKEGKNRRREAQLTREREHGVSTMSTVTGEHETRVNAAWGPRPTENAMKEACDCVHRKTRIRAKSGVRCQGGYGDLKPNYGSSSSPQVSE